MFSPQRASLPTLIQDVSVVATFAPRDPIGATYVDVDGQDTMDPARYLVLIDEAVARYRTAPRDAARFRSSHPAAGDGRPSPAFLT